MGPISTDKINDSDVMRALFDSENRIFRELAKKPSIIVGRKGAGKTAFLRSIQLDNTYQIISEIKTHEAFSHVLEVIEEKSARLPFVESVAEVWNSVFWTTIFSELVKRNFPQHNELSIIQKYMDGFGLAKKLTADNAVKIIIDVISEIGGASGITAERIKSLTFNEVNFSEAKSAAVSILQSNSIRAVVLMDSVEDFHLDQYEMKRSISGLLKSIGQFHESKSNAEVRFCIPSEMWHAFYELSSNPLKDFENHVLIHWHASELIPIVARRLAYYIELHAEQVYHDLQVNSFSLGNKSDSLRFLKTVLAKEVTNGLGNREDSIAYILRHTQLLPRQLFTYFSNIISKNRRSGNNISHINEVSIKEGVYSAESDITNEIFSAYLFIYPCARKVCEKCLPYLPFEFPVGDLHKIFNRHGRKVCRHEEFDDFMNMLIEMGIIGRVVGETDRYVEAMFEYTVPHKLVVSSDDRLCLHPAFCQVFSAKYPPQGGKVVYPYGSDFDGNDYREW